MYVINLSEACHCVVQHLSVDIDISAQTSIFSNGTAIFRAFTFYGVHHPLFCPSGEWHWMAEAQKLFYIFCFFFLLPTRLLLPADIKMIKVIIEENFHWKKRLLWYPFFLALQELLLLTIASVGLWKIPQVTQHTRAGHKSTCKADSLSALITREVMQETTETTLCKTFL